MRMKMECYIDDPSAIAYEDVYEKGDRWEKIRGCHECPPENRDKCCNNCGMYSTLKGCYWHIEREGRDNRSSKKPFYCITKHYPSAAVSYCSLEFKCVRGSRLGKIRRVKDRGDVFQEG